MILNETMITGEKILLAEAHAQEAVHELAAAKTRIRMPSRDPRAQLDAAEQQLQRALELVRVAVTLIERRG